MGGPRGATTSAPAAAPLLVSRGPAARYFPRDLFFCFFTFKLTIGAFAPVPRETGLETGCFFDFPAMAILLGRGEWQRTIPPYRPWTDALSYALVAASRQNAGESRKRSRMIALALRPEHWPKPRRPSTCV